MHLLQSGVDITVIALWLGHEDTATTHMYVQADLAMKEQALMKLQPGTAAPGRFRASDNLMSFLKTLRGLIPYEYICKCWTTEPERFTLNPHHQMPGPNTSAENASSCSSPSTARVPRFGCTTAGPGNSSPSPHSDQI